MNIFGIILDGTDLWLLAIAGACLAWFVTHRLSIARERQSSFRAASIKFRSDMFTALNGLYPHAANWPDNSEAITQTLRSRFPAIQVAISNFRPFVQPWKRRAFDRAWLNFYCAYPDKIKEQCYHHYYSSYDPFTSTQQEAILKREALFHANVQRLLSYAKEP